LGLALAGLEAGVGLVDDVNATLATDQLVVAMAFHQTLEGIADFHVHTYMGSNAARIELSAVHSGASFACQPHPETAMALPIVVMSQPFIATSVVFLAAAGSFAGLAIKDRRPRESLNTPLIPTIPQMLLSGIVAMMALAVMMGLLR
jgi:zinc transporter ZupT